MAKIIQFEDLSEEQRAFGKYWGAIVSAFRVGESSLANCSYDINFPHVIGVNFCDDNAHIKHPYVSNSSIQVYWKDLRVVCRNSVYCSRAEKLVHSFKEKDFGQFVLQSNFLR